MLFSQKGEIEPIKLEKIYTINGYLHTKKLKNVNYDQFLVKKIHGGEELISMKVSRNRKLFVQKSLVGHLSGQPISTLRTVLIRMGRWG